LQTLLLTGIISQISSGFGSSGDSLTFGNIIDTGAKKVSEATEVITFAAKSGVFRRAGNYLRNKNK